MKIVIISEAFAKNMGYISNMLPKSMAKLGVEVHVLALNLSPYYQIKDFKQSYSNFMESVDLTVGTIETIDGFQLHRLNQRKMLGYMSMIGLEEKLQNIEPDIVYTLGCIGWLPLQAALAKRKFNFKLFTGNHTTHSTFPLTKESHTIWNPNMWRNAVTRWIPGRLVSLVTETCYGATIDCSEIAGKFFGVQKAKIDTIPLGVDTDLFFPMTSVDEIKKRDSLRNKFGLKSDDLVCIYTGRMSTDKNPLLLADAITELRKTDLSYHAIFLGDGVQKADIEARDGCIVHPFVPVHELPDYYRACDIGIWPTQESTSMLDAAASGLPIVVNNTLSAIERVDGNGLTYVLGDVSDLARVITELHNPELRKQLGDFGAVKMATQFSWMSLAKRRLGDFTKALSD